ncbi:MAG: alpha/beta fold hydrolase [Deltaproteobacteria bacterium]|nr:alpha/beta fold hydrolase [Deltaproteobacteria bacterium]
MDKKNPSHRLGVLVLHGFTTHISTLEGLKPALDSLAVKYSFPVLRGHGTHFSDLKGVTYLDWLADAEQALKELLKKVDRVIVVGYSMGGLIALQLGIRYPDKILGLVTVAAALKFTDPLVGISSLMGRVIPYWKAPVDFADKKQAAKCKNYKWFPVKTFASLYDLSLKTIEDLPKFKLPILIIHSKKDRVIAPKSAEMIYQKIGSKQKSILWFLESGHEMMLDLERKKVFEAISHFIKTYLPTSQKTNSKPIPKKTTSKKLGVQKTFHKAKKVNLEAHP